MNSLSAVLIGGPADLPPNRRLLRLAAVEEVVRCKFGAGYECFHFLGERMAFDPSVLVYEWSHREEAMSE
ncbi:DUF5988 family protein [Pseudonocardia sp.]|jgi:hypothetical protein|uniref:DUF5988 family protein n=1 Tax=Pseudonocardia sp. TaxID=60912 RepID=UPI0039C9BFD5